jgi:hypothetical protein
VVLKKILRRTLDSVLHQPVDDPVGLFLGFGVVAKFQFRVDIEVDIGFTLMYHYYLG